jgi:hypothetical protein
MQGERPRDAALALGATTGSLVGPQVATSAVRHLANDVAYPHGPWRLSG